MILPLIVSPVLARKEIMYKAILALVLFASLSNVYAITSIQTDWHGMGGILGPKMNFGYNFFSVTGLVTLPMGEFTLSEFEGSLIASTYGGECVITYDFDSDGDLDVLAAEWLNDKISWWENTNGLGTTWTEHLVDDVNSISRLHIEDINNDGYIDIIGETHAPGNLAWWENDGSGLTWTMHSIEGQIYTPNSIDTGDIDGDGDMDILAVSRFEQNVWWWENINNGSDWSRHIINSNWLGAYSVRAGDVDQDGDVDVMTAGDKGVVWWTNNDGSGQSWTEISVDQTPYCTCATINDIDSDGDIDIAGANDEIVSWWENLDGSGTTWTKHIVSDTGFMNEFCSVVTEDVNLDGNIDIVAGGTINNNAICLWENDDGSGLTWTERVINSSSGADCLAIGDINGDSSVDIVSIEGFNLKWWNFVGYASGSLESSILYLNSDPDWSSIEWDANEPTGTDISIQVRASDDENDMGIWSEHFYSPGSLDGILDDYDSFLQYRVFLTTSNSEVTPTFEEIRFIWNTLGVQDSGEQYQFEILPTSPNPSTVNPVLQFTVPEQMSVTFSVFDLLGRKQSEVSLPECTPGIHSVTLHDVTPGIYFCRINSDNLSAVQTFTVVE